MSNFPNKITDSATLYRTGDFAKIEKNVLLYEGRLDSQIKVRGHRVDMSEVQAVLNRFTSKIDKSTVVCYKSGHIEQVRFAENNASCKANNFIVLIYLECTVLCFSRHVYRDDTL